MTLLAYIAETTTDYTAIYLASVFAAIIVIWILTEDES